MNFEILHRFWVHTVLGLLRTQRAYIALVHSTRSSSSRSYHWHDIEWVCHKGLINAKVSGRLLKKLIPKVYSHVIIIMRIKKIAVHNTIRALLLYKSMSAQNDHTVNWLYLKPRDITRWLFRFSVFAYFMFHLQRLFYVRQFVPWALSMNEILIQIMITTIPQQQRNSQTKALIGWKLNRKYPFIASIRNTYV